MSDPRGPEPQEYLRSLPWPSENGASDEEPMKERTPYEQVAIGLIVVSFAVLLCAPMIGMALRLFEWIAP